MSAPVSVPPSGLYEILDAARNRRAYWLAADTRVRPVFRSRDGRRFRLGNAVVAYWNPEGLRFTGNASQGDRELLGHVARNPEVFHKLEGPCPTCERWVSKDLGRHTCARDKGRGAA